MKQFTNEEILAKVTEAFADGSWSIPTVEVTQNTPQRIEFTVENEYEAPPFNSGIIFGLCEFFGTKHINDVQRWSVRGCDTCDWGSSYGFRLEVLPDRRAS